jgi:hypothetical protein
LFDQSRQQREVIVLYQHDRIFNAAQLFQHRLGEFLVDLLVLLPISVPEDRPCMRDVTERPQAFV